eukprot:TRINITY_DN90671_c0_g1_i1.p1 TRINITY_DN90671_c0_g1~~TRINITY_DN90671_c0_g1_i1.p1  ORF type:complete len:802 (-),score=281.17 TRINITY_DN90671_c0_g1_i1:95-2500(-)
MMHHFACLLTLALSVQALRIDEDPVEVAEDAGGDHAEEAEWRRRDLRTPLEAGKLAADAAKKAGKTDMEPIRAASVAAMRVARKEGLSEAQIVREAASAARAAGAWPEQVSKQAAEVALHLGKLEGRPVEEVYKWAAQGASASAYRDGFATREAAKRAADAVRDAGGGEGEASLAAAQVAKEAAKKRGFSPLQVSKEVKKALLRAGAPEAAIGRAAAEAAKETAQKDGLSTAQVAAAVREAAVKAGASDQDSAWLASDAAKETARDSGAPPAEVIQAAVNAMRENKGSTLQRQQVAAEVATELAREQWLSPSQAEEEASKLLEAAEGHAEEEKPNGAKKVPSGTSGGSLQEVDKDSPCGTEDVGILHIPTNPRTPEQKAKIKEAVQDVLESWQRRVQGCEKKKGKKHTDCKEASKVAPVVPATPPPKDGDYDDEEDDKDILWSTTTPPLPSTEPAVRNVTENSDETNASAAGSETTSPADASENETAPLTPNQTVEDSERPSAEEGPEDDAPAPEQVREKEEQRQILQETRAVKDAFLRLFEKRRQAGGKTYEEAFEAALRLGVVACKKRSVDAAECAQQLVAVATEVARRAGKSPAGCASDAAKALKTIPAQSAQLLYSTIGKAALACHKQEPAKVVCKAVFGIVQAEGGTEYEASKAAALCTTKLDLKAGLDERAIVVAAGRAAQETGATFEEVARAIGDSAKLVARATKKPAVHGIDLGVDVVREFGWRDGLTPRETARAASFAADIAGANHEQRVASASQTARKIAEAEHLPPQQLKKAVHKAEQDAGGVLTLRRKN